MIKLLFAGIVEQWHARLMAWLQLNLSYDEEEDELLRATLQQQVLQEHNYVAQVHGDSQPRH